MKNSFCTQNCSECPVVLQLTSALAHNSEQRDFLIRDTTEMLTETTEAETLLNGFFEMAKDSKQQATYNEQHKNDLVQRFAKLSLQVEEQFHNLDAWDNKHTQDLKNVQTNCHGPTRRKQYFLFGATILKCTSPQANWYPSSNMPNGRSV